MTPSPPSVIINEVEMARRARRRKVLSTVYCPSNHPPTHPNPPTQTHPNHPKTHPPKTDSQRCFLLPCLATGSKKYLGVNPSTSALGGFIGLVGLAAASERIAFKVAIDQMEPFRVFLAILVNLFLVLTSGLVVCYKVGG